MTKVKPGTKLRARRTIRYCMGQVTSDKICRDEIVVVEFVDEKKGTFTCENHADRYGPWHLDDFKKVKGKN